MNHDQTLRAAYGQGTAATVNRIVAVFKRATPAMIAEGAAWYPEVGALAAEMGAVAGKSTAHAAAVIAHTSPRTSIKRNLQAAGAIMAGSTEERPFGAMGAGVERARAALASTDPLATVKGPKTAAFAANILGDEEAVTVDVWALRVAFPDHDEPEKPLGRKGVYDAVAHAYRLAARRLGVTPPTCQAVTWVTCRGGRAW